MTTQSTNQRKGRLDQRQVQVDQEEHGRRASATRSTGGEDNHQPSLFQLLPCRHLSSSSLPFSRFSDAEIVERKVFLTNDRPSDATVPGSRSSMDARRVRMAYECLRFLIAGPLRQHPTALEEITNLTSLARPRHQALWLGETDCFIVARTTRRGGRARRPPSDGRCRYLFTIRFQLRTGECTASMGNVDGSGSTCACRMMDCYQHVPAAASAAAAPTNDFEAMRTLSDVDQLFLLLGWAAPHLREVEVLVEATSGGDDARSRRIDGALRNDTFPLSLAGVREFCLAASRAAEAASSALEPVAVEFQVPLDKLQWRMLFACCPRNVQLVLGSSAGSGQGMDRFGRHADGNQRHRVDDEDASSSLQPRATDWASELAFAYRQHCTCSHQNMGESMPKEKAAGGGFSGAPQTLWLDLRDCSLQAVLGCLMKPNQGESGAFCPRSHPLRKLVISYSSNFQDLNDDDYDEEDSLISHDAPSSEHRISNKTEGSATVHQESLRASSYASFIGSLPQAFPGLEVLDLRHLPPVRNLAEWNMILDSIGMLPALRCLHLGSIGKGRNWYRQQERNEALVCLLHGSASALVELTYDDHTHQSIEQTCIRPALEHNQFRPVVQRIKSWTPSTSDDPSPTSSSGTRIERFLDAILHSPPVHSNLSCACLLLTENSDLLAQLAAGACKKDPSIATTGSNATTITIASPAAPSGQGALSGSSKTSQQTDLGSSWSRPGERLWSSSFHPAASPSRTYRPASRAFHRMIPC